MFHSARWKAYINDLQKSENNNEPEKASDPISALWHFYHSQNWFTREESNGHAQAAQQSLDRCDSLLKECRTMNDDLAETLANTPKPSECLDWGQLW